MKDARLDIRSIFKQAIKDINRFPHATANEVSKKGNVLV
jgi:hypothetical protein